MQLKHGFGCRRYFLQRNRKALTFFLKCVNWKDAGEVKQVCVRFASG